MAFFYKQAILNQLHQSMVFKLMRSARPMSNFPILVRGDLMDAPGTSWHLTDDRSTKINGEKLAGQILSGAVIV